MASARGRRSAGSAAAAAGVLLFLLAGPLSAQGRGEIAVGVGLAIGVRTGPVVSVAARGGGDAGVICRAGGLLRASAVSCGPTLWFSERQLAVAEVGLWIGRERAIRGPVPVNRVFLSLGTGIVEEGDGSARPVYDVGAAVFVARWDVDGWSGDAGWTGYGDLRVQWVIDQRDP